MNPVIGCSLLCALSLLLVGCSAKRGGGGDGAGLATGGSAAGATRRTFELVAHVETLDGLVWSQAHAGEDWVRLEPGDDLPAGALIETGRRSSVVITLGNRARVEVMAESMVQLQAAGGMGSQTVLYLGEGRIRGTFGDASLRIFNPCGSMLELTPRDGAEVPFDFSNGPNLQLGPSAGFNAGADAWATTPVPEIPLVIRSGITTIGVVPEPSAAALLGGGAALLAAGRVIGGRRRG